MLGDGKWNSGDQGSFYKYQFGVLKLLEQINASIVALPGVDYETRTTLYKAIAPGPGYSTNDILVRYDIINVNTGAVSTTVWFNATTQGVIAAPAPGNITPYNPPSNVTAAIDQTIPGVTNGVVVNASALPAGASTAALQTALNTLITTLNGLVSTSANQVTLNALITTLNGLVATSANQTNKTQWTKLTDGTHDADITVLNELKVITSPQPGVDIGDVTVTNLPTTVDTNYGVVGANTIRTAAEIGNATGAADFGAGVTGAQTLRVVLPTDQTVIPVSLPTGAQTISSVVAVAPGATAGGETSVGFTTDSLFTGTINGVARNASTFYGFEAAQGKTLPIIAYTVTAGSVIIDRIV